MNDFLGYFIDAGSRRIETIRWSYGGTHKYLPGGLAIGATFATGDVLYVDDEGLLRPASVAFRIKRRLDGQPMMSNGLLTGEDGMAADFTETTYDPKMTIQQLQDEIEWLDLDAALDWFRAKSDEAAVTTTVGESRTVDATWGDLLANLEGRAGYRPRV